MKMIGPVDDERGQIESILDSLLEALIEEQVKSPDPGNLAKPAPMQGNSESLLSGELTLQDALRLIIRHLGQRMFIAEREVDHMRRAAERIAAMDSANYGKRMKILDSAWNGIGAAGRRYWVA